MNKKEFLAAMTDLDTAFGEFDPDFLGLVEKKFIQLPAKVWKNACEIVMERCKFKPKISNFYDAVREVLRESTTEEWEKIKCEHCNGLRMIKGYFRDRHDHRLVTNMSVPCPRCRPKVRNSACESIVSISRADYERTLAPYLPNKNPNLKESARWMIAENRYRNPKFDDHLVEWAKKQWPDRKEFESCVDAPMVVSLATNIFRNDKEAAMKPLQGE